MDPNDPQIIFIVDVMLGKLAKWLRVLGLDTRIEHFKDRRHIESFLAQHLIPVTRTEKWRNIGGLVFIRNNDSFEQLQELLSALNLRPNHIRPFTRCSICNSVLSPIQKSAAFGNVPDFVFETAPDFRQCPECRKIYWPGSHRDHMLQKLKSLSGWKPDEVLQEYDGKK